MNTFNSHELVPDRNAIATHLSVLFDGIEGYAAIRLFAEKGTPSRPPKTPFIRTGANLVDQVGVLADEALQAGVGLFAVPGVVDAPGRATANDVSATAVVLVDLDEGDIEAKAAHLVQHLGPPTLDVLSGGRTENGTCKRHLYWRLTSVARGEQLAEVCRLRSLLASLVGADPAFGSAHQPVRIAGSVHGKHGIRSPVAIRAINPTRYELGSLIELAGKLPPFPGLRTETLDADGLNVSRLSIKGVLRQTVREGGVDGISRFGALSIVMGHFLRKARLGRMPFEAAWDRVRDHNARMIIPPWSNDRLRSEFLSLERKDRLQHGWTGSVSSGTNLPITEDALADRFSDLNASEWRYVAVWSVWLKWVGSRWQIDPAGEIFETIRHICREAAISSQGGDIRRICSDRTIRAVERIARSDPRHTALPEEFDADTMLLNTPAGVVDLRTGEIGPHQREAAMTRQTAASPGRNCPQWAEFLRDITGGDAALLAYLARVAGYCLSGDTTEQVFFFLHGGGANGKSVFLSVLADVLGDYGVTAPLETFMVGKGERHPTDLAGLRGARLVTVNETESGRAWAESRIKAITGGDKLRVRLMHRDFFEFQPTFKLLIAGNHRPRLSGVGEAMRRRLHLVPFEVTIPPERRDRQLLLKLRAERDGILGWMLEGCAEWRRLGLAPPATVVDAAHQYFEDEDVVGQWIDEECQRDRSKSAAASALFASWAGWADRHGLERGSQRELGEALKARGFEPQRSARSRGWQGIVPIGVPISSRGDAA